MAESYTIDGVDVGSLLTSVQTLSGAIGAPPMRQSDFLVPGRPGATPTLPWAGPRSFAIGGTIAAETRAEYQTALRAFMQRAYNGGRPVTLGRTLDLPGGGTLTTSASARYSGGLEQVEQISPSAGRLAVDFSMLDAFWYGTSVIDCGATTAATFSLDVAGDVWTHKVTVRFNSTASTQRLTNLTTGDWVQYGASTAASSVLLDVEDFTAVQGSTNRIQYVTSGDSNASYFWMTLAPGINTFTLTGGGSVRLVYRAAYL